MRQGPTSGPGLFQPRTYTHRGSSGASPSQQQRSSHPAITGPSVRPVDEGQLDEAPGDEVIIIPNPHCNQRPLAYPPSRLCHPWLGYSQSQLSSLSCSGGKRTLSVRFPGYGVIKRGRDASEERSAAAAWRVSVSFWVVVNRTRIREVGRVHNRQIR